MKPKTAGPVPGLIFMTGRNCAHYVQDALTSLAEQQNQGFEVLFVDDASSDATADLAGRLLKQLFPGRHTLVESRERKGKARHAFEQLRGRSRSTFVAILDADDRLIDRSILGDLVDAYAQGFDVVWTNYLTDTGLTGGNGPLDPTQSPRGQGWKTSHFFSFRQSLFDNLPPEYLQDDAGRWFECACDFAIAYPILDQTRRYLHLPRTSYRYTATNPQSHHQQAAQGLSSDRQRIAARQVLAKQPLALARNFQSHAPSVAQSLSTRLSQTQEGLLHCRRAIQALEERVKEIPFQTLALQRLVDREGVPASWLREAGGWALDIGLLAHIADVLDGYPQPRVLEFGSGRGTKTLAKLVANRGGRLVSVEHDPHWFELTRAELRRHGLSTHARVQHSPLVAVDFHGIPGRFYDMQFLQEGSALDVVIVDGPPAKTISFARLPALPSVASHLAPEGFHILLDDYEREDEQSIMKLWRQLAPELNLTELRFAKGVAQLSPEPA